MVKYIVEYTGSEAFCPKPNPLSLYIVEYTGSESLCPQPNPLSLYMFEYSYTGSLIQENISYLGHPLQTKS